MVSGNYESGVARHRRCRRAHTRVSHAARSHEQTRHCRHGGTQRAPHLRALVLLLVTPSPHHPPLGGRESSGTPHDWSRAGRRLLRWLFSAHWLRGPSEFSRCGVVLPVACVSSYGRCSHPWLLRALGPGHSSVSFHPRGDAGAWPSPPVWPPRCCPPSEAPARTFPLGRSVLPRARVPEPSTDFPCLCLLNTVTWAGGGLVTSPWRHISIRLRGWGGSGSEKWPLTCYVDGTVPAERSSVGCGLCKMTSQTHFSLSLN